METPSFKEDHISQIPALQLLINMGFQYLSPANAVEQRGGKTSGVLLENILRDSLQRINTINYKNKKIKFSDTNIQYAVQSLKDLPMQDGYINASQHVYDLITMGKSFEQAIEGDKKSFTLRFIDWENPSNNVYHVSEEYNVLRTSSTEHYRPDIVLFINGIPIVVIECKRPDIKDSLDQAISQSIRNQQEDGIRSLYVYSQMVMALSVNDARFATTGTEEKFWSLWKEKFNTKQEEQQYKLTLHRLKNTQLQESERKTLFGDRFKYVHTYFEQLEKEDRQHTSQDEMLFNLCRPERLLDFIFNYILYDDGEKKIARFQQYFTVKSTLERIKTFIPSGNGKFRRKGGVIWHTQGSGKSLTMVMLAQQIAMDKEILNPKIVLVTDRVDLDSQITDTFKKCGKRVKNATVGISNEVRKKLSGYNLTEQEQKKLNDDTSLVGLLMYDDSIITTIINKFDAAVKQIKDGFDSTDIFVLVDEAHRSQYNAFNMNMQKVFPNACFLAFTGTPLLNKDKNTAAKFGGIIDPPYTINEAVADKAVVPLLFEGRHVKQNVNETPIDAYFSMISEPLTQYQRVELKKEFSRADHLNEADQKIYCTAWDISKHFRDNWKGTEFKGQLVTPSKIAALKYKMFLDEIGYVTSEVLISPPDDREGSDNAYEEPNDKVVAFWKKMMSKYGGPKKYQDSIISSFKKQETPEIIIVVDKLITGFDAPRNTVMYITRNFSSPHTLLQAIARVNRVFPGKDYGYIIDYYGIIENLDIALTAYEDFKDFDEADLQGTLTEVKEEVKKLPQAHSELWDIFKEINNKYDEPAYEELLRDEAKRLDFYDKTSHFIRLLKLALSTIEFEKNTPEKQVARYKEDAKFFLQLRIAVKQRYSDGIDYKQYEQQVQKLIDTHITSDEVIKITELVNIFDKENFQKEVEKIVGEAAKADTIATRTQKTINVKWEEDPAFYKKFSDMLKEAISDYEAKRISEAEYLARAKSINDSVVNHTNSDIPSRLNNREVAQAFFGVTWETIKDKLQDDVTAKEISADAGIGIDDAIREKIMDNGKPLVEWHKDGNVIIGKTIIAIQDFLYDLKDKYKLDLSFDEMDAIAERSIEIAKVRYK
ncbi:HsdR family type I site-specific deoxyribonuclease [soil metagenome]